MAIAQTCRHARLWELISAFSIVYWVTNQNSLVYNCFVGTCLSAPGPQEKRFAAYVDGLATAAGHQDRQTPLRDYCKGLLLPGGRQTSSESSALWCQGRQVRQARSLGTGQRFCRPSQLEARAFSPSTVNVRLAAVRKLASEAADNALLAPELAAGMPK